MWALNLAMCVTPVRWWETHRGTFQYWEECRKMMILWFEPMVHLCMETFLGQGDLCKYLAAWIEVWCKRTEDKWVHLFIHALGPIPTAWYLDADLLQCTLHWETMRDDFLGTFRLIGRTEALDEALQDIDGLLFDESDPLVEYGETTWDTHM